MPSARTPYLHVITPGDHFSPRTGSAVPTVVDGLSRAGGPAAAPSLVAVARGTYPDRHTSAEVVEYDLDERHRPVGRYLDLVLGSLGLGRPEAARGWRAALSGQQDWPASFVFGHNGVQLVRYVDTRRHRPVLYAHNELLRSYRRREVLATLGRVDRIVCVSDYLADVTAARLPAPLADRIRVVVNGADTQMFHPPAERADREVLTVAFVGRTIPDKGPDVLLEAVARAGRADIQVEILGSYGFDPAAPLTEYEKSLRRIAARITPAPRFVAAAPRSAVPEFLRRADVLVVPSRWPDPCPLTIGEGMASGAVVVASRIGGIAQSLGDAGILVEPDDPVALADALTALADDAQLRRRYAGAARARAEAHDWVWARRNLDEALAD